MQLEFNFNQTTLKDSAKDSFSNMYSIIICMQIISNPV